MKSHLTTLFIALIVGYLGGISSQFFHSDSLSTDKIQAQHSTDLSGPLHVQTEPGDLRLQIEQLQQKTDWLEMQLNEVAKTREKVDDSADNKQVQLAGKGAQNARALVPDKENLVSAGVDPDVAEDILRRISQQEFRRLELQNLIQRDSSAGAQQYRDELRELNQNKISLRDELGDDTYDQYLMVSGINNRVKVTSVMAESPAELNGIQKGDVVLYYDDRKIFAWSDLRKATLDGAIGSFTNMVINRDGMRMSLVVPRGTLGVQLEAIQSDPDQEW